MYEDIQYTPQTNIYLCKNSETFSHSWVEISAKALKHNITLYKNIIGSNTLLAPVIKSNAYGHGITEVASLLQTFEAVDYLCVAKLSEALYLRKHGITKPILVLSIIDANPQEAIKKNIDLIAYDLLSVQKLQSYAKQLNKKVTIHIKIDTGLSRMGVLWSSALKFVRYCAELSHCSIKGIFTHLANSEDNDSTFAQLQLQRFKKIKQELKKINIHIPLQHSSCSASQTTFPESHGTFARLGLGLYGLWPSIYNKKQTQKQNTSFNLMPVMTWKTQINMIKEVPKNSFIGYGLTYKTTRPTRIAVLPIGYDDGYNRLLSNKGIVKIKNQYASVLGRVSMNLTIIDITDISNVTLDDHVTLLGNDNLVNANLLADLCSTINYEIVTRVNPRLNRVIIE